MIKNQAAVIAALAILFILISGPGCATKKFVKTEVDTLDQEIQQVQVTAAESRKKLEEHEGRLASLGSLTTRHQSELKGVENKIEEVKKMTQGTLVFKEVLKNDEVKFGFDRSELSPEAKAVLDGMVHKLVELDRGIYLEIQGHTDSTGPESWNLALGERRAEAVEDYLHKQHHIPLHRMDVISLGSSAPVADNASREGRAENRRVEMLVYE
jgi:outer membrane protein OmpA-like peptidoglycan-associated protein